MGAKLSQRHLVVYVHHGHTAREYQRVSVIGRIEFVDQRKTGLTNFQSCLLIDVNIQLPLGTDAGIAGREYRRLEVLGLRLVEKGDLYVGFSAYRLGALVQGELDAFGFSWLQDQTLL